MISSHLDWGTDCSLPLCGLRASERSKFKNGENKGWRRRRSKGPGAGWWWWWRGLNDGGVDRARCQSSLAGVQGGRTKRRRGGTGCDDVCALCNVCRSQVKRAAVLCCRGGDPEGGRWRFVSGDNRDGPAEGGREGGMEGETEGRSLKVDRLGLV